MSDSDDNLFLVDEAQGEDPGEVGDSSLASPPSEREAGNRLYRDIVRLQEALEREGKEYGTFEPKTAIKKLFIRWLTLPKGFREPSTQKEFSELLPISQSMLSKWKRSEEVDKHVKGQRIIQLSEKDSEVFEALVQSATLPGKEGSKDRQTYLKLRGYDMDRLKVETEVNHQHEAAHSDDEDLIRMFVGDVAEEMASELGVDKDRMREVAERRMLEKLDPAAAENLEAEDAEYEVVEEEADQEEEGVGTLDQFYGGDGKQ